MKLIACLALALTLATGAHPSEHGMIGNAWFNRVEGRLGYNIEDPDHPMLPVPG